MKRLKKFLLEFFLVFKAPQGIHGFEDIVIDEVVSWNDVSLDHLHHWSLQLKLTFTPSSDPGMSIDFLQLKKTTKKIVKKNSSKKFVKKFVKKIVKKIVVITFSLCKK